MLDTHRILYIHARVLIQQWIVAGKSSMRVTEVEDVFLYGLAFLSDVHIVSSHGVAIYCRSSSSSIS